MFDASIPARYSYPMTTLGGYIRQRRIARHLSVRDFAKRSGLSPAHVSDIELGRRHPSEAALGRIARGLGVNTAELRASDSRPPLEDIRRMADSDPLFSAALRAMIDSDMSGGQLLDLIGGRKGRRARKR